MKDKYIIGQYIIDYIPIRLLNKITIKDVYEWREFLFIHNIFELKDIYVYLDNKLKQYDKE
jgi:hypothetical protein